VIADRTSNLNGKASVWTIACKQLLPKKLATSKMNIFPQFFSQILINRSGELGHGERYDWRNGRKKYFGEFVSEKRRFRT
jgi:hypothetical protein